VCAVLRVILQALSKKALVLTKQYGTRCLEGTSDVIESEEHGMLIEIAITYAEQYNIELLKKLKEFKAP
jgi:hypothetical protein